MQLYNNIRYNNAMCTYLLARNKNRLVTLRIAVRDKQRLHNAYRVAVLCRYDSIKLSFYLCIFMVKKIKVYIHTTQCLSGCCRCNDVGLLLLIVCIIHGSRMSLYSCITRRRHLTHNIILIIIILIDSSIKSICRTRPPLLSLT